MTVDIARPFWRRACQNELLVCAGLFVLTIALFIFVEPPEDTIFWDAAFDVGHAVLFGFVMWLALRAIRLMHPTQSLAKWGRTGALLATLFLAGMSEMIQWFQPTRNPSVEDFLRDAAGAVFVLLLHLAVSRVDSPRGARRHWQPIMLRAAAFSLMVGVALQFAFVADVYLRRDSLFPILLRLDGSRWERQLVSIRGAQFVPASDVAPRASGEAPFALLRLRPGRAPGLRFQEPYPNWSGHKLLIVPVYAAEEAAVTLTVRVYDAEFDGADEDRFDWNVLLLGGRQSIEIPLDRIRRAPAFREMDLRRIRGVELFAWHLDQATDLYVGPLRLE